MKTVFSGNIIQSQQPAFLDVPPQASLRTATDGLVPALQNNTRLTKAPVNQEEQPAVILDFSQEALAAIEGEGELKSVKDTDDLTRYAFDPLPPTRLRNLKPVKDTDDLTRYAFDPLPPTRLRDYRIPAPQPFVEAPEKIIPGPKPYESPPENEIIPLPRPYEVAPGKRGIQLTVETPPGDSDMTLTDTIKESLNPPQGNTALGVSISVSREATPISLTPPIVTDLESQLIKNLLA